MISSGKIYKKSFENTDRLLNEFLEFYSKASKNKDLFDKDLINFESMLKENTRKYGEEYYNILVNNFSRIKPNIAPKDEIYLDGNEIVIDFFSPEAYDYFDGDTSYSMYDSIIIGKNSVTLVRWREKN
jgi:hypothetical protein